MAARGGGGGGGGVVIGVDVGTSSARAGVVRVADGRVVSSAARALRTRSPRPGWYQQRSAEVWRSVAAAVREALRLAEADGVRAGDVRGLAFDATCSLVVVPRPGAPPADVSPPGGGGGGGDGPDDIVLWMCHRAVREADEINATRHEVLDFVGGRMSAEMEPPKLLWLKRRRPDTFGAAEHFFDLADFLAWRASGSERRSACTVTCKWGYRPHHPGGWTPSFWRAAGLGELAGSPRVGRASLVSHIGAPAGALTAAAARELGLPAGVPVACGAIDAHAGGIGVIGAALPGALATVPVERRLALIAGTSACHMAVSAEQRRCPGVWGPYRDAMLPGMWLLEGGQSAAGALLDHVVSSHAAYARLLATLGLGGGGGADEHASLPAVPGRVYEALNRRLEALHEARGGAHGGLWTLADDTHVLPYFHGNRSPRADPTLVGAVSGLRLAATPAAQLDALAVQYLAAVQALALGTRHILEAMRQPFEVVAVCGGLAKNPLYVAAHADATGCHAVLPREPEAVLLGSAVVAAAAAEGAPLERVMRRMTHVREAVAPRPAAAAYYARKFRVFLAMHDDLERRRAVMSSRL